MFNDDGERVDDAKDLMSKNIIVADIGFGTFDPYGIINRKKALEESINNLGMKRFWKSHPATSIKIIIWISESRRCENI